jgi:hypothetical protein
VSELGNLMGGILLSPRRMSTVKIRARSLFRTPRSRIGAEGAGFGGTQWPVTSSRWLPVVSGQSKIFHQQPYWPRSLATDSH